jgi:hypothetical protein
MHLSGRIEALGDVLCADWRRTTAAAFESWAGVALSSGNRKLRRHDACGRLRPHTVEQTVTPHVMMSEGRQRVNCGNQH